MRHTLTFFQTLIGLGIDNQSGNPMRNKRLLCKFPSFTRRLECFALYDKILRRMIYINPRQPIRSGEPADVTQHRTFGGRLDSPF